MINKTAFVSLLIGLIAITTINAQRIGKSDREKIDSYLASQIREGAPGLAVGVIRKGQVVYESYLGLASLEHNVPVNKDTRFNIASVAKQFTALATLKLILEEKVSLQDDIRKYLPELYPEIDDPIQIRHLLNHSSGIRDVYDLMGVQRDPWWRREGLDNDDIIEYLMKQKHLNFQPGTEHLYSNANYTLLARIVSIASGMSFHDYTRQMFEELGMSGTSFLKNYMHVIPNRAVPYTDWGNGVWKRWPMMTDLYGDGFLFTTLKDMLTYQLKVQAGNSELLNASQQSIEGTEIDTYGYGLKLDPRLNYRAVHHDGSTGASHAQTVWYPTQQLSIVVLSNNGTIWSGYIADKIASILLPEKRSEKTMNLEGLYDSDSGIEDLVGEYERSYGRVVRIIEQEGELYWRNDNNSPIKLEKEHGSLFRSSNNPTTKIGFNEKGLTLYRPDSEPAFMKKLPSFTPSRNYVHELSGTYYNEEIDVQFEISQDTSGTLKVAQKGIRRLLTLEIIQKDRFLASDYIIQPERDQTGKITDLLLTYARLKNIRFKKTDSRIAMQKKYTSEGGYIQVGTTSENHGKGKGDILLTKNAIDNNEEWSRTYGGKSYDKASSIELTRDGGCLIIGSTSSYGKGNYDVWVIKVDGNGKEEWNKTFGYKGNEYGISAMETESGYLIKAQKQECPEENQWEKCVMEEWYFEIDEKGNVLN